MTMPIAHYLLNDNAANTTVLDTIGSYNGTGSKNTNLFTAAGKINQSFLIGNAEYFSYPNVTQLNGANKASWAFWWKYVNQSSQSVISKWETNQHQYGLTSPDNSQLYFFVASAINDAGNNLAYTVAAGLNAGTWYHIVYVYDGTLTAANRVKLWMNNNSISLSVSGTIPTSLTNVAGIGKVGYSPISSYLGGNIDDVRIYNVALGTTEIAALYNSGSGTELDDPSAVATGQYLSTMKGFW